MVKARTQRTQAVLDVSKAFAVGELSKSQDQELLIGGKAPNPVVAAIPRDALIEFVLGEEIQQLGENGATLIHGPGFRVNLQPKSTNWPPWNSNRKNAKIHF